MDKLTDTKPLHPIKPHDPDWRYTPATHTDVRETWRRYVPDDELPAFLRRQAH